ncbi:MAG: hypothetical protein DMG26_14635, partial [Acidobacteria bacterium]
MRKVAKMKPDHRLLLRKNLVRTAFALIGPGLLIPTSAPAQTYFYGYANFATGRNSSALAAADFNGDGKPDLAVANFTDNTVSILLGKPEGTFVRQVVYPTGNAPKALVAADFNGDGKLDLATVNNSNGAGSVSILVGNGNGTFRSHVDYATGDHSTGVVAADFNRDGKVDLAVANDYDNSVSILLGNGDGTFQSQPQVSVGANPIQIQTADFNGDGKADLITLNACTICSTVSPTISVLLGVGDGTFSRKDSPAGNSPSGLAVGDFNGDGKTDVAIAETYAFSLLVLLGNGDGTFPKSTTVPVSFHPTLVVAGDFNHDGKADLAVSSQRFHVPVDIALILGNGDGTFAQPVNVNVGQTPYDFVIEDFNADGQADLALVANSDSVSILLGQGNETFGNRVVFPLATGSGPALVADFSADGKPDIAVAESGSPTGEVSVMLGKGDGTFQNALNSPLASSAAYSTVSGDFNGDGKIDIAAITSDTSSFSSFYVLLGNGDGTFQSPVSTFPAIGPGIFLEGLAAGDFNGDGKTDLALVTFNINGTDVGLIVYISSGDGTFQAAAQYSTSGLFDPPLSIPSVIAADFNDDHKLDLAVTDGGNQMVSVFIGNGDGTFRGPAPYPTGLSVTTTLAAADFNGDGKVDLAVGGQNGVSILPGNGDGTFGSDIDTTGFNLGQLTVADFNTDGKPDLGGSIDNGSLAFVLVNNGDGTFRTPVTLPVQGSFTVAAADFNSDGSLDLAVSLRPAFGPSAFYVFFSAPAIGLFPTALNFGSQSVGSSGSPQTVTLGNPGNGTLSVTSIVTSGAFAETNTCSGLLAPGEDCMI